MSSPASSPEPRRRVECIHCGHVNEISPKAISATCTGCRKAMRMDELRIKDYQARRLVETCSTLTVERKGDLRATTILCNGAILRGKSTGDITSRGPVMVGPEAEHTGNVVAPTIAIPPGAILQGHYRIGPGNSLPKG